MALSISVIIYSIILFLFFSAIKQGIRTLIRERARQINGCLPPRRLAQKDPLFGIDVLLQDFSAASHRVFLKLLQSRHNAHGLTFASKTCFGTTIHTCDPAVIQQVLSFQFPSFDLKPLRLSSGASLFGEGILTTDGESWAHHRRLIKPAFTRPQIVNDLSIFQHHVDQLIAAIKERNYVTDLQELFFRMVIDSNTKYMFGESIGLLHEDGQELASKLHHSLDNVQKGIMLRMVVGNLALLHWDPEYHESCRVIHEVAEKFVRKALKTKKQHALKPQSEKVDTHARYNLLDEFANATEDPIQLRDQIVHMLLASGDTTSNLLSFTFFILARRPDLWTKLRQDVLEHYCEPLTIDAVMKMTYLRDFLRESLRLFPPFVTNSRVANKDTVLPVGGGPEGKSPLFVSKGEVVMYNIFAMQRRKEFFGDDVEEFRPERWKELRRRWEYLPFSGGPRNCIGQIFSFTEASYCTARLLYAFQGVENLDPSNWRENIAITLSLDNGVHCRLVPA
ncbi:putative cytochrome P450 alkane hydroxylase [Annulohypoxylon moriforme]|nr:putative cytochrome P450 alkane hydroxylase [Annulohypoxylon moriforme]